VTALVRRHRGLAVAAVVGVLALAAALYVGTRWRSVPPPPSSAQSIEDLRVTQLTSTGTAEASATHFADNRIMNDFAWSRDGTRLAIARATVTNDIVLFKGLRR
jgi:hypothetical protein